MIWKRLSCKEFDFVTILQYLRTGNFLTCPGWDSNGGGERQLAVSDNA